MRALFFIFWRLHKLCKHHFLRLAICISYASAIFCVLPFAEAPQAPNFLFCHLRKLRKRQIFCFAICGSSASAKFLVLPFAEAPQASKLLFSPLRNGDMCWNGRGGACVPARTSAQRRFHTQIYLHITYHAREFNDGCALVGRHGRAHRHRPYQTPSCFSVQSYHNQQPLRPRSYKNQAAFRNERMDKGHTYKVSFY